MRTLLFLKLFAVSIDWTKVGEINKLYNNQNGFGVTFDINVIDHST